MKWGVPECFFCCWAPLAASNTSKVASGSGPQMSQNLFKKSLFEPITVCCWPTILVKIAPNRSCFTFGPPLPARITSKVASGLLLGCSWAAPGLLSQKHEQPATTNNLRQFGLLRWGVRVVVSTRRSERWVRLHTIASISSRDLVLGVSAERGVPEAVRASIAKLNINITWHNNYKTMKLEETKSIYIYISMHLYINIAIYIYLSLYIYLYLYIYLSIFHYIYIFMYLYICWPAVPSPLIQ